MTYCGRDWLRGARTAPDLQHLFTSELLDEFDAIRLWLHLIRTAILQENEVTENKRGKRHMWMLQREVDCGWTQMSKLFLSNDRHPSVRNSLIEIHNTVTPAAAHYRLSRLLPPPIFVQGELVPPTLPPKAGKLRRFITTVRTRLASIAFKNKVKPTDVSAAKSHVKDTPGHNSVFGRVVQCIRNIASSKNQVLPV
ncbi:uncharacterized protein LOC124141006 [Haliotis rufescens]|uniref:uncharacterized protein LOC124141006 n=1 Tax=Haliotis rufescens TaxID=6454 RepID=UPI00201EC17E|nr:uncharacterized protein LOC124141006 [Haliotis rufescens]